MTTPSSPRTELGLRLMRERGLSISMPNASALEKYRICLPAGWRADPGEFRRVVERTSGRLAQSLDDLCLVERGLHSEGGLLDLPLRHVEAEQHGHRQDHVAALTSHVQTARNIAGDAPDEVGNTADLLGFHEWSLVLCEAINRASMTGSKTNVGSAAILPEWECRTQSGSEKAAAPAICFVARCSLSRLPT